MLGDAALAHAPARSSGSAHGMKYMTFYIYFIRPPDGWPLGALSIQQVISTDQPHEQTGHVAHSQTCTFLKYITYISFLVRFGGQLVAKRSNVLVAQLVTSKPFMNTRIFRNMIKYAYVLVW